MRVVVTCPRSRWTKVHIHGSHFIQTFDKNGILMLKQQVMPLCKVAMLADLLDTKGGIPKKCSNEKYRVTNLSVLSSAREDGKEVALVSHSSMSQYGPW